MKITICGSIAFYRQMLEAKSRLEELGHEVSLPPKEIRGEKGEIISIEEYYRRRKSAAESESWIWDRKEEAIRSHFNKVAWADAILVLNCEKHGIEGYIGANTLMEMGLAFFLGKPIYLLNKIPEADYKEEILGMKPTVLGGELGRISKV